MANTEIRNALQYVREAEQDVADALKKPNLTKPQRNFFSEVADALRDLDDFLVNVDLNKSIDDLVEKSEDLQTINKQVQKKIDGFEKVAKSIDDVAKAVNALAKAFKIIVSAGLA